MKTIIKNIDDMGVSIEFTVGQNENENDELIDASKPDDYWFHTGYTSSCHVVANMPTDLILSKNQLRLIKTQGAVICKQYSKLKSKKNVEIVYTKIKKLTKTDKVGQVIMIDAKTIII
jgi:predicted ribosome quality control (RQC) complex YloA/Tae2 family protein